MQPYVIFVFLLCFPHCLLKEWVPLCIYEALMEQNVVMYSEGLYKIDNIIVMDLRCSKEGDLQMDGISATWRI